MFNLNVSIHMHVLHAFFKKITNYLYFFNKNYV